MSTELRTRHIAVIGASLVTTVAILQGMDIMDLKEFYYGIAALVGLDWGVAKFKKTGAVANA